MFDLILWVFFIASTLWFLGALGGSRTAAGPFSYLFWSIVFGAAIAWRNGWIQKWLAAGEAQQRQARIEEKYTQAVEGGEPPPLPFDPEPVKPQPYKAFAIAVAKNGDWQPQQAISFARSITQKLKDGAVWFSVEAYPKKIVWLVYVEGTAKSSLNDITTIAQAYYPRAEVSELRYTPAKFPLYRQYTVFKRVAVNFFDFALSADDIGKHDPLALVVQTMGGLRTNERLSYELNVTGMIQFTEAQLQQLLTIDAYSAGYRSQANILYGTNIGGVVLATIINQVAREAHNQMSLKKEQVQRFTDAETANFVDRLTSPLYPSVVSVTFETPDQSRMSLFNAVVNGVKGLSGNALKLEAGYTSPVLRLSNATEWARKTARNFWLALTPANAKDVNPSEEYLLYLADKEVAAFWHLPHGGFTADSIAWTRSIPKELIRHVDQHTASDVRIGYDESLNEDEVVVLHRPDRRRHVYVSGRTGMGKSTLLHNLIFEDIYAGCGVAVLDFPGTLLRDIVQTTPAKRRKDIVYLSCADREFPVPLNLLRTAGNTSEEEVFSTLLWLFKTIYAAQWSDSRMETAIRLMLRLALFDPEATLLDIEQLAINDDYRRSMVEKHLDNEAFSQSDRNLWNNIIENMPDSARWQMFQPVLNRLSAFLGTAQLELMTCHPQSLNFHDLIEEQKIVLIDLSGGGIANEAGVLGAIFLGQFFMSSINMGDIAGDAPPRFYLYADEAQLLFGSGLPRAFSEARKYGLSLTLGSQFPGQFTDEKVYSGIMENISTKISLSSDPRDETVQIFFEPDVTRDQIKSLSVGQIAVKTQFKGRTLPAFTVDGFAPPDRLEEAMTVEEAIAQTRQQLGFIPASQIRAFLKTRYSSPPFTKPKDAKGESDTGLKDFGE